MSDWMSELARQYERMRSDHPGSQLCVVFDIDGTIVDTRHMVVEILLSFDRLHGTNHFLGLRAEHVTAHERNVEGLLETFGLDGEVRDAVRDHHFEGARDAAAVHAAHRPYPGVLSVIRWLQLQPNTHVALNTGRPETTRRTTLASMTTLGALQRVRFDPELLMMNPRGWEREVERGKVEGIRALQRRGLRVVAVIDNEPANLAAMAAADDTGEILFLHADTLFRTEPRTIPRSIAGRRYALAPLVQERHVSERTVFVWHGVNDGENLRQFLRSQVRWAECDVRSDPLGRLVLRHDSFEQLPWGRADVSVLLKDWLEAVVEAGRCAKLDVKEGGQVLVSVLDAAEEAGIGPGRLWINGAIETLGEEGFRRAARRFPGLIVSCPVDDLRPWFLASPRHALESMDILRSWGVTRASAAWAPGYQRIADLLEDAGWEINLYGMPDLEAFLEATLLESTSVTADFNFPRWGYRGRGSGAGGVYADGDLVERSVS